MTLIGLYSPAAQSGKTAVANVLATEGFARVPFAAPLKRMACEFLENLGYPEGEAARVVFVDKHEVIPQLGVTVRHLLQTLGTEWGRTCIDPDVWIHCWAAQARKHQLVVADDVRFPNEAQAIIKRGGQLWKIVRPGLEHDRSHASEGGLDDYDDFTHVIHNDGSLSDLRSKVLALL